MKDVFGKDITVGNYVIYIASVSSPIHIEKAIVVESEEHFIKIEYFGESSRDSDVKRKKGKRGRITATEKKIVILNSAFNNAADILDVMNKQANIFAKEKKNITNLLAQALQGELDRTNENELLRAELDKIHNRFDILDL